MAYTDSVTLYFSPRIGLVLALLEANDREPIHGRTRLVKMIFLLQEAIKRRGIEFDDFYDFESSHYVAVTFEIFLDLELAKELGLVREEEVGGSCIYRITEEGSRKLREILGEKASEILEVAKDVKREWNQVPLSKLLQHVYENYPDQVLLTYLPPL